MYYRRTIHILTMFRRLTLSIESCLNIIRGYIIRFMLALLIASLWHRYALACLVSHAWYLARTARPQPNFIQGLLC